MERDSFIFYRSFLDAVERLPKKDRGDALYAICKYGISGDVAENISAVADAIFTMAKPNIDANNQRFANGKNGGRPRKEKTESKPNENQTKTKVEPNEDVDVDKDKNEDINPHTTSDEVVSPPSGGGRRSKAQIDLPKRQEKFKKELSQYLETYGREMLNAFFFYWTESNPSKSKMRFECEKTWNLSRRLARWAAQGKGFSNNGAPRYQWLTYQEASKFWSATDPQDNWTMDPQTKLWRRK